MGGIGVGEAGDQKDARNNWIHFGDRISFAGIQDDRMRNWQSNSLCTGLDLYRRRSNHFSRRRLTSIGTRLVRAIGPIGVSTEETWDMTYKELAKLCEGHDELDPLGKREDMEILSTGLLIRGKSNDQEFNSDVFLRINKEGTITCWVRDPEEHTDKSEVAEGYGREWCNEFTGSFDQVHTWLYEL